MARDVTLRCQCGAVEGRVAGVTPRRGTRLICHCTDCQAFARHSGVAGVMNSVGGTEIFQTLPGRVHFTKGAEDLLPLNLAQGGLLRWMTRCCRTPMGNMLPTPAIRFVGLPTIALPDPADRDALGPLLASLSRADAPEGANPPADFGNGAARRRAMLRHFCSKLGFGPARSPYFKANGRPLSPPTILTDEERLAAYRA